MPTQPGRFGYLGPSPFGPFDLGPGGTTRQRIGTPTTSVAVQRLRDKDKPYGPPPPLGREGVPIPNVRAGRNRRHFTHAEIDNINDFAFGGAYHPRQIIPSMDIEAEGRRLGLGALTTPSDRQMANQAARTMQQQPGYYPNLPAAAGPALAATTGDAANIHATPEEIRAVEVPLMRGSSQVSTPQLEDRTYVAGWGYMTRDDMMRFNHGTPEEKARIRAKYQR